MLIRLQIASSYRLNELAAQVAIPRLREKLRRFVHSRLYPDDDPALVLLDDLADVPSRTKIAAHLSAAATFYAPSELCGPGGMHCEIIRCNPSWYHRYPRYDTILVTVNHNAWGMARYRVARVRHFWSFALDRIAYPCALVEWFVTDIDGPDRATGLWVVRPEIEDNVRATGIIPLSSIARACHLMPVLGSTFLPSDFHFSDTLDAFKAYYVNAYIDYHSHEVIL